MKYRFLFHTTINPEKQSRVQQSYFSRRRKEWETTCKQSVQTKICHCCRSCLQILPVSQEGPFAYLSKVRPESRCSYWLSKVLSKGQHCQWCRTY